MCVNPANCDGGCSECVASRQHPVALYLFEGDELTIEQVAKRIEATHPGIACTPIDSHTLEVTACLDLPDPAARIDLSPQLVQILDQGPHASSTAHAFAAAAQITMKAAPAPVYGPPSTLSATEAQGQRNAQAHFDLVSRLMAPYRGTSDDGKNAPPWAADLAQAFKRLAYGGPPRLVYEEALVTSVATHALRWCAEGEPVARASRVLALLKLWPGSPDERLLELSRWLDAMRRTGAGRPKFRSDALPMRRECEPRAFVAPVTYATWAAKDAADHAGDE
jgi:hypothetical protein